MSETTLVIVTQSKLHMCVCVCTAAINTKMTKKGRKFAAHTSTYIHGGIHTHSHTHTFSVVKSIK